MRGSQFFPREIWSGLDKSFLIQRHTAIQPCGVGNSAGHDKNMFDVGCLDVPSLIVSPADTLQAIASLQRYHFGVWTKRNRGCFLNATDQIARHGVSQA